MRSRKRHTSGRSCIRPLGLLPITLFALFVAVTASPLYRHLAWTAEARKLMSDNVG